MASTPVGSLRRARVSLNSLPHFGTLRDVARAAVSDRACNPRRNDIHRTNAEISPDFRMGFVLWSGLGPACEPTTHRSVRKIFLPTPHHRAECPREPPVAAYQVSVNCSGTCRASASALARSGTPPATRDGCRPPAAGTDLD